MGRVHDGLGFTNETDWNAVQPLVQKVFDAQRDVMRSGGMSRVINITAEAMAPMPLLLFVVAACSLRPAQPGSPSLAAGH